MASNHKAGKPAWRRLRLGRLMAVAAVMVGVSAEPSSSSQRLLPRPQPVAETKLLMQGINESNFQGLEKLLREKPATTQAWTFARGQALLIAECGNLLMLRPPSTGRAAWLDDAGSLRSAATRLARAAADRDPLRCRQLLGELAASCNRCHAGFGVGVRIPLGESTDSSPPVP